MAVSPKSPDAATDFPDPPPPDLQFAGDGTAVFPGDAADLASDYTPNDSPMTSADNDLLSAALACVNADVSIVPIDHTTKRPTESWKCYQSAIAGDAKVRSWFASGINAFAVVGGAVSGGLLVLDFDVPLFYDAWRAAVGNLADGLPVQQTGGGGFQVLLRCPDPGGNDKLAWMPDEQEETGRTIAIETRGEGGYAVVAPSLHPSGNRYKWIIGDVARVPTVTQEHADKLLAAARALDEMPHTRQEIERLESQAREFHQQRKNQNGQADIIGQFNARYSIDALLVKYGHVKGIGGRYIRPGGKSESVSAKDGRSFHWSSNDPLNDGKVVSGCGCHDCFDVFTHYENGGDVRAAVKAAAELLGIKPAAQAKSKAAVPDEAPAVEPWPDPLPLPAGLPPVLPFNFDLLPVSFHAWIQDIAQRMQCPPDYLATVAMIVAGSLVGRKVCIRPKRHDNWQVVVNLYGANVGPPSWMKTPTAKEIVKYLEWLEVQALKKYNAEALEQETAALVAAATKKVKQEALKQAVKDGADAQSIAAEMMKECAHAPTRRRYIIHDSTIEKLGVILNENPNGIFQFFDELITPLRTFDRDGHEADRGFYLTAWDGNARYSYDRIGRGTLDIEAAIVSVFGNITPGPLAEYLRGAVQGGAGADGLMQRFQLVVWPDAPTTWRNIDRYPDPVAKADAHAALQRLEDLTPIEVEAERDSVDTAALPFLRFDRAAQALFDAWREGLELQLRSGREHPCIEAHLAKYRSLIPSLALILHLLDGGMGPVTAPSLGKAIEWGKYLESHARRLYATVTDAPAVAARLLAARIQAGDVVDGFGMRDVYRMGWSGLDKDQTGAAIDVLLALHWIEERIEDTTGRTRTRYAINPKIVISPRNEPTKPTKAPSVSNVGSIPGDLQNFEGAR